MTVLDTLVGLVNITLVAEPLVLPETYNESLVFTAILSINEKPDTSLGSNLDVHNKAPALSIFIIQPPPAVKVNVGNVNKVVPLLRLRINDVDDAFNPT